MISAPVPQPVTTQAECKTPAVSTPPPGQEMNIVKVQNLPCQGENAFFFFVCLADCVAVSPHEVVALFNRFIDSTCISLESRLVLTLPRRRQKLN
jgi:hypothetical protein